MIETQNLRLRPFAEDDLDIIYKLYSDREILKYTPYDCLTREEAARHLAKIIADWQREPRLSYELAVILKDSGEKIGRTHILIDPDCDSAMIGWFLVREAWGKHFAGEMTRGLLEYCFEVLKLHRVYAVCNPENIASRRVLEQGGFRQEALLKQKCRYIKDGRESWHDEMEYAMLASEWR